MNKHSNTSAVTSRISLLHLLCLSPQHQDKSVCTLCTIDPAVLTVNLVLISSTYIKSKHTILRTTSLQSLCGNNFTLGLFILVVGNQFSQQALWEAGTVVDCRTIKAMQLCSWIHVVFGSGFLSTEGQLDRDGQRSACGHMPYFYYQFINFQIEMPLIKTLCQ